MSIVADTMPVPSRGQARSRRPDAARAEALKGRVASALCLVPAIYCLGVAVYALLNASDYAAALPQLLRYVLIPLILGAALIAVAMSGSRFARIQIGGIATGLLTAFFLYELVLEARYYRSIAALMSAANLEEGEPAERLGLPAGWTPRRLNREMGTRTLNEAVLGHIPGSLVRLCKLNGQVLSYRADRYGFRNPNAAYRAPVDLLLVGDSFVEGFCLPDGVDLAGQIRRRSSSMVSMGMRGAGPLHELAVLKRFGPAVRPRWTVIVFWEGNDWDNLEAELRTPWLRQALDRSANVGPARPPQPRIAHAENTLTAWYDLRKAPSGRVFTRSNIVRNTLALHQTWTQLGLGYPPVPADLPEFDELLAQARETASRWDGRVAIAYLPQSSRFTGPFRSGAVYDQVRNRVRGSAEKNALPFIDLTDSFAAQKNPLAVYGPDHLSPAGASLSAAIIRRELDRLDRRPGLQ